MCKVGGSKLSTQARVRYTYTHKYIPPGGGCKSEEAFNFRVTWPGLADYNTHTNMKKIDDDEDEEENDDEENDDEDEDEDEDDDKEARSNINKP